MGTDELGRDTLSRTLYGARVSLTVAASVVFGCGFTGLMVGMSRATLEDGLIVS